jgi:hypothetical protein
LSLRGSLPPIIKETTMAMLSKGMKDSAPTFIKGALAGIAVLVVAGQFWPGYILDSGAKAAQEQAVEVANNATASLLCSAYYQSAPDGAASLARLRSSTSHVGENKEVDSAVSETFKAFKAANISPMPSEYRVKSDCVEALRKMPEASAKL